MARNWKADTIFAALAAAAVKLIEPALGKVGIPAAGAVAIVLAAVGIGLLLRYAVVEFPTSLRFWRRHVLQLTASAIEAEWLEVLNRRGQVHYSVVQVRYNRADHATTPYVMIGYSYFPDRNRHSDWSTPYLRVETSDMGLMASYVYAVKQPGSEEITKYGYGETRFDAYSGKGPRTGRGYYLAVEEDPPYKCEYEVHRIDAQFTRQVKAAELEFGDHDSMQQFVRSAHEHFHPQSQPA